MSHEQKTEIGTKYSTGKKYMRAKEVSNYMGIGLSTVWMYSSQGKITPKKLSARVTVFSIEEIDNLINNVEVSSCVL